MSGALTAAHGARIRRSCPAGGLQFSSTGHFFTAARMAEGRKAKTAEKGGDAARKRLCPSCGAESRVVQFAGFGPRGFYWVCDKNCGYSERTRGGPLRTARGGQAGPGARRQE